jgi:Tol biopolymer transport system component
VQYFERRRLELHPEHAGTPYEVQLGLLGGAVWELERRPPPTSVELDPQLTHLLALSVDETTRNLNIVRVGRFGADPTIVNDSPRPGMLPREPLSWSADGLAVAFIDPGRPRSVLVLSADGRLQERSVALPSGAALDSVDWSPLDDTLLLGIAHPSGQPAGTIALLRPDGGAQTLGAGRRPRWAPDGTRLVYEVPRPDRLADLVVMRADGGGALQIGVGSGAAWSPDGSRLAFSDPGGKLIIVGADGGAPRRLGPGRSPAWSPEGQRLAFDRFGGELVVAYADGADPQVVLRQEGVFVPTAGYSALSWSPDGAQLAFRFTNRSSSEAGVVRLDSGEHFTLSGAFLPPRWEMAPRTPLLAVTRRDIGTQ